MTTPILVLAALAAPAADPRPDAERILGVWTVMAWQDDDFEKVGLGGGGHTLTVKPDLIRVTSAGKAGAKPWTLATNWTLDPAKKWLDFPGERMGLYDLDGDTLRVVVGKPGNKNRPTAFESSSRDNKNGNDKYLVARRETGFASLLDPKLWEDDGAGWKADGGSLTAAGPPKPLTTVRGDLKDFTLRLEWLGGEGATGQVALRNADGDVWRIGLGCKKVTEFGRERFVPTVSFRGKDHKPKFSSAAAAFYADVHSRDGKLTVWVNGANVVDGAPFAGAAGGSLVLAGGESAVSFRGPRLREAKGQAP